MTKRTQDTDRAKLRRDRQHGETEEDYQARVLKRLKEMAGDKFADVTITRRSHPTGYTVAAYSAGSSAPAIKIERETLGACASAFDAAAGRLAGGFARS